jgi:hypothetical protein
MQPWTDCTVSAEGHNGDASPAVTLNSGAAGVVRFYPPSQEWGTRLTLSCALDGKAQGTRVVDLNDDSTFKRESASDLEPRLEGTLPALSGDLSAPPFPELLRRGYPPRPDAAKSPKLYARWVAAVTKPASVFRGTLVAHLESSFLGEEDANWATGFVQSANGFPFWAGGRITTGDTGTLYSQYAMETYAPVNSGCSAPMGICATAIWGGLGGTVATVPGFGNVGPTSLLQSGFSMSDNGPAQMFVEFVGGTTNAQPSHTIQPPSGDKYAQGDEFLVWGWTASDGACDWTGGTPLFGCFGFWDLTNNWSTAGYSLPVPASPDIWFPTSAEFMVETVVNPKHPTTLKGNASYGFDLATGAAWDTSATPHADPGTSGATDDYVYTKQADPSGSPYSTAMWSNGTTDNAVDPMYFQWRNAQ